MSYPAGVAKRISLSKIYRDTIEAPTIFIGERQRDIVAERKAVQLLGRHFPGVNYRTEPDGSQLIPITEVIKLQGIVSQKLKEEGDKEYSKGHADGLEEGLQEAQKVLKQFEGGIAENINQRHSLLEDAKARILQLVVQISRKVTFDAIEIDRDATATMISNIIDQLTDRTKLKIKVHPDFLPILEQHMDRFLGQSTEIKDLAIESDPRVKHGGCFIETPSGDVDARIESQIDVIDDILHDAGEPE